MLVLSRKVGESVRIGEQISVTLVAIQGNQVRLGFTAPNDVRILRQELVEESTMHATHNSCVAAS